MGIEMPHERAGNLPPVTLFQFQHTGSTTQSRPGIRAYEAALNTCSAPSPVAYSETCTLLSVSICFKTLEWHNFNFFAYTWMVVSAKSQKQKSKIQS